MTVDRIRQKLFIIDPIYEWKMGILKQLAQDNNLEYLLETGTWVGNTPVVLSDYFRHIYTIEASESFFLRSKTFFREYGIHNVTPYLGLSEFMLGTMLKNMPLRPTLFYLDAHGSGGDTVNTFPTPEEVRIITANRSEGIIVIDDMENTTHPQTNFSEVAKNIPSDWQVKWRRHSESHGTSLVILYKEEYKV